MATEQQMVRNAQIRSAIIAFLAEHSDQQVTSGRIIEALRPKLTKLEYTNESSLYGILSTMHKNNLIGKGENGYYFLSLPVETKETIKQTKKVFAKEISHPAIKVDLVKSSGKVRLTIGGMVIEVGVVDQ
jgi:hypothetical protein